MLRPINTKGETGIGTLVVFIAMVLVAAIAAGVLLGTAGGLQQKSLTVGKQTQMDVSTGIQVVTVTGTNGSDGTIEAVEMIVKLTAGSNPFALNDTLITLDTKTKAQSMSYCGQYPMCGECNTNFSAEYLTNGTDHLVDYITTGDIVKLRFNMTSPISQAQTIRMRIVPKRGVVVPVDFMTPDVVSTVRVILYP